MNEGQLQVIDLSSWKARKEHTPAAVCNFFNIMKKWRVSPEEARMLLGGISPRYYRQLKDRQEGRIFSTDRLCRISYLISIHKALRIAYGAKLENQFVHSPNWDPLFGGSTPLSYMMHTGLIGMYEVRRLLDARAAGN